MKTRRFYDKSYEHPAIRFSKYWNIDESFGHDIYQFMRIDAWGLTKIQKHFIKYLNKKISSKSLRNFNKACVVYEKIQSANLKKGQKVGISFFENS